MSITPKNADIKTTSHNLYLIAKGKAKRPPIHFMINPVNISELRRMK
jgi:hypothetical protein